MLILIALLPSAWAATAQNVSYSPYEKFDFKNGEYAVVGKIGALYYNYRTDADGYYLDAYDDSMNKTATVVLDFFPAKIYETKFMAYPDKILVLYQALESNKVVQYGVVLDNKGIMRGKPIMLGSAKTGILGAIKTYFAYAVSENKKLILVYSIEDKNNKLEFDGKWLDDNLTVVKRGHAVFDAENQVEHGEVNMANDSTVYISAYTPDGVNNYADQYGLLKIRPGVNKFELKELALNDKYAAGGYVKIDNVNNKLYFGGFYSDKKNGNFNGLIFARYDAASGQFESGKFIPFDQELVMQAGAKRPEHAFDNYLVRQLIIKNDGGFAMIAECQFITARANYNPAIGYYSFYSPYSNSTVREYHYNDIMVLSYTADGKRDWSSIIPKEQYSQEDGGMFSSYAFLNTGGTLVFLYNDFNRSHSGIRLATVGADGNTAFHSFAPEGNDNPDWLPKAGKQVGGREMIVPCLHKRQICFAKIGF